MHILIHHYKNETWYLEGNKLICMQNGLETRTEDIGDYKPINIHNISYKKRIQYAIEVGKLVSDEKLGVVLADSNHNVKVIFSENGIDFRVFILQLITGLPAYDKARFPPDLLTCCRHVENLSSLAESPQEWPTATLGRLCSIAGEYIMKNASTTEVIDHLTATTTEELRSDEDVNKKYLIACNLLYKQQNPTAAARLFTECVASDHPGATTALSVFYRYGLGGVRINAEKWTNLAMKAANMDENMAKAYCYMFGFGEKDQQKAFELAMNAVDENILALSFIGWCYYMGKGVTEDENIAVTWYRRAAELGCPIGMTNLGVCLENGEGVEKDREHAKSLYSRAGELGFAPAQARLGGLCAGDEAIKWLKLAGQQGHADALFKLGQSLESAKYYQMAANLGHAAAQTNLGYCYEHGIDVTQNFVSAVLWYRRAAEQGRASAQYNLGTCYEMGRGVIPSQVLARRWYEKAANQGHSEALDRFH